MTERLRVLADWLPVLGSGDLDIGHWVTSEPGADGVMHLPWFDYSPTMLRFLSDVARAGWVQPFDWMAWAASPAGQAFIADPRRVAAADADDLQRLLTSIVRGDRFIEGNIAGAFESGMLVAIVRRAGVLLDAAAMADGDEAGAASG